MKKLPILFVVLVALSGNSRAQLADSFDVATFNPPPGWKKQIKPGVVIYNTSDEKKGSYAIITLYLGAESSGDPARDFAADWQELIAGPFAIKNKPEMEPAKQSAGYTVLAGGSAFENEIGPAAVILNTYSGHGHKFSSAAVFNSTEYVPALETFFASIKLRTPETKVAATPSTRDSNSAIVGTWSAGSSGAQRFDDYKNPYSVNGYGYGKNQYTFKSDGTYDFFAKTFRITFDKILLVKEHGTYQISGNTITIAPRTSVIQAWSKRDGTDKWGKLLTTQNRPLEKVTYQFTKHYFSGIQIWNLVLQAQTATERDGPFSTNTTFNNAWYYAPISPNNTAIELPQ